MTLLPSTASKANADASSDDPEQALLVDLPDMVDKFNQVLSYLVERLQNVNGEIRLDNAVLNEGQGSNIAAASTCDIGAATGNFVVVTGSTTINRFGTVAAGARRVVQFNSTPTLTYNATSMILPGDESISVEAGDCAEFISLGSNNWVCTNYQRDSNLPVLQGTHTIWVPKNSWIPRSTNGPAEGSQELTTNKIMVQTWDFDNSTQEYAQVVIGMPDSWDTGTVQFIPYWTAAAGAGTVIWELDAASFANDDGLDSLAFGTAQTSTDTFLTADDLHIGPKSSAITISGSPGRNEYVVFRISRNGGTKSEDAKLLGIKILYTVDRPNDSAN